MATEQRLEFFKSLARDGLIDSNGGIRAVDSAGRLYDRMLEAGKLAAKAAMLNVIKYTDETDKTSALCHYGAWKLLNRWLTEARREENRALERLLLEVFHRLPVTVDMLKSNDSAKMVKHIAKGKDDLADLASSLVDKWMDLIKAEHPLVAPPSEGESNGPPEQKRKRLDSGSGEPEHSKKHHHHHQQQQRKTPSTARTAPANFRDTNLLASDEPPTAPASSAVSPTAAAAKPGKHGELADNSKQQQRKRAADTDLESIHASISVKPASTTSHQISQQLQQQQRKRTELHLDSGFMDSLFASNGSGGGGGGGSEAHQHQAHAAAKLVRKRKKAEAAAAGNNGGGGSAAGTPTTPEAAHPPMAAVKAEPSTAVGTTPSSTTAKPANEEDKKPRRRVSWAPPEQLEQVTYFDLDETERVNVNRQSVEEMARREHERERELLSRARAEGLGEDEVAAAAEASATAPHRAIRGRAPQWYKPLPISDLPAHATESASGRKSAERGRQAKRQEAILQVFYFSREAVPPSPGEPDVEHVEQVEPRVIPLEDMSKVLPPPPPPPTTTSAAMAAAATISTTPAVSAATAPSAPVTAATSTPVLPTPASIAAAAAAAATSLATSVSTITSPVSSTASTLAVSLPPPSSLSASSAASSSSPALSAASSTAASTVVSDLLMSIGQSSDGGLALKDEVANVLRQVTRHFTTGSPATPTVDAAPSSSSSTLLPPPPLTSSSSGATTAATPTASSTEPSPKEVLWRILRSHYPDLSQKNEELSVAQIRQLLEPLREELAASGKFSQLLGASYPCTAAAPAITAVSPAT